MSAAHARVERVVKEKFVNEKPTSKSAVLYALKKAAPALKLRPTTWRLLSVLCDHSQAVDWEDRRIGPVVWPSNAALADRVGVDIRSIQVHLRRLVQMGLITHSDSATRKRFGTRVEGRIVQACGINLSPLLIRREQLLELAAAHETGIAERKKLAQLISEARIKLIRLISGGLDLEIAGPWSSLSDTLAALGDQYGLALVRPARSTKTPLSTLHCLLSSLISLEVSAQGAWDQHLNSASLDEIPSPAGDERFTLKTKIQNNRESLNQGATEAEPGIEVTPSSACELRQDRSKASTSLNQGVTRERSLDLNLLKKGCPALLAYYPDAYSSVQKLAITVHQLRGMLGISSKLWEEAQRSLGAVDASLALLVILQGHEEGRISSPGGYLHRIATSGASQRTQMLDVVLKMAAAPVNHPLKVSSPSMLFAKKERRNDMSDKHQRLSVPPSVTGVDPFRQCWLNQERADTPGSS
ncbi:hypothetical protein IC232_03440 [Microvirga sp. BT688]|nr:hypothetical protein [Microvirga sp.]